MVVDKLVLALIDTGAEVIVILRSLANNLGLSIFKNVYMKMLVSKGNKLRFLRVSSDVEIFIREVRYRLSI
jgi:predicted aspartyl protease